MFLETMTDSDNTNQRPTAVADREIAFHHTGLLPDTDNKALRISNILQSTLDLGKILELFDDEVSSIVEHDGFRYFYAEDDYQINFGSDAKHKCQYNLILMDTNVGEIIFSRKSKFTDEEIELLENLIAALIYPVRNALLYKQAVERAHRDPLTGIGNRAAMDKTLEQEVDLANRHGNPLSIIIIDIDKFKPINDTYGHIIGDSVLKTVSDCMVERMRRSDIIYRYGGEEFLIVLRNTSIPGAELLAERIRKGVEKSVVTYDDIEIKVTVSAGLTALREQESIDDFLSRCDKALYQAKEQGRNRVISA